MHSTVAEHDELGSPAETPLKEAGLWHELVGLFDRFLAAPHAQPYRMGYDAFHAQGATNPHRPGSDCHARWEQGYLAAADDFEW